MGSLYEVHGLKRLRTGGS